MPTRTRHFRTPLVALLALALAFTACSTALPFQSTTPADVRLRGSDLPSGMRVCHGSGDVGAYLTALKKSNPRSYQRSLQQWKDLQGLGASAADVQVFASDQRACSGEFGGDPKAKVALSYVVKYKDDASARKSFKNGFLGLSPRPGQQEPGLADGSATGLGQNSWTYSQTVRGQPVYLAYWHHHAFTVFLGTTNLSSSEGLKAAADINGRLG